MNEIQKTQSERQAAQITLPTAQDCMQKIARLEAEEARKQKRDTDSDKKKLLEQFQNPSGVSDDERLKRAVAMIQRAVRNRLHEVEVGRFPNQLCTDRARAIIQGEPGWENTLTGLPLELFKFWKKHLEPNGYKMHAKVVDYPHGVPGDIALTLSWH